ncbi:MAG: hypothetical protein RL557_252 [archaeon]|jgi:hypothetical protein
MTFALYEVFYRSFTQKLAGGPSKIEQMISAEKLHQARVYAMGLPTRVSTIHHFSGERDGVVEKELLILHRNVVIVVPTVDSLFKNPLDTYNREKWPGISFQSEDYISMLCVAQEFNLPLPSERDLRTER